MNTYEYEITTHAAESFREVAYFCSETGDCTLQSIPSRQIEKMRDVLNERGSQGWELVQASFGKDGLVAFWKRMVT